MEAAAPASQKYEEFEPATEIVQEKDCDTILLHVPGFKKEKMRVQLTSTKVLRISGESEVENKYVRFQKEFPVSSNYDTNKITAKFERGILYIRQPKLITTEDKRGDKLPVLEPPTPQKPADKPQTLKPADEALRPHKPADEPQPQKNAQQKTTGKNSLIDDGPSKQTNVQDAPQKKLEKEEPMARNEKSTEWTDSRSLGKKFQEEKTSFTSDKPENDAAKAAYEKDKETSESLDGSGKTRMDNYKGTAVDLVAKLKMSRRVMNVVLVVLLAVVLGLYIPNFIRYFRSTAEN